MPDETWLFSRLSTFEDRFIAEWLALGPCQKSRHVNHAELAHRQRPVRQLRRRTCGRVRRQVAWGSSPQARQEGPRPQIDGDLHYRRNNQHAKHRFRRRPRGALNQHCMDDAAENDHRHKGHMTQAPDHWFQAQPPAERGHERNGEHGPPSDHAPSGEWRWRPEKKCVDHVRRAGYPKSENVDCDSRSRRRQTPQ